MEFNFTEVDPLIGHECNCGEACDCIQEECGCNETKPEWNEEDSNILKHARKEFLLAGYIPPELDPEDGPNKWIQQNVLELLKVFAKQGHSGFSAPYCVSYFNTLAKYELLTPLTGNDDEWNNVSDKGSEIVYQNNRCGSVFKNRDNKPYHLDAIIWVEQDKCSFTGTVEGIGSRQYIKEFPFTPKTFYIDVTSSEDEETTINDKDDLIEVFNYYLRGMDDDKRKR